MAVIQFTTNQYSDQGSLVTWETVTTGDTGNPFEPSGNGGSSAGVQISGTFNGGTTAVLQGSNDGTNWATATDRAGNAISATAAAVFDAVLPFRYVRPSVGSGSSDDIDVVIFFRR